MSEASGFIEVRRSNVENNDCYVLWSIGLRASDSRVIDTHEREVGGCNACFPKLTAARTLQMYAIGTVAHIPWIGLGTCRRTQAHPSVRTLFGFTCELKLGELPDSYTGGLVVSSSPATYLKGQPRTAHVPGYLSTSVEVVRLWKWPRVAAHGSH